MTYTLFADDQCTRLIKRTEHNIWNAVPNFQACVMSANGNGRTSLTVCQDEVKLGKQVINDPPPMFLA